MRSWIGIALAGVVLSASGCGDDGPRPASDGPPNERELAARWRGVEIGARDEEVRAGGADSVEARNALLQYPAVVAAPTPEIRDRLQAALSLDSAIDLPLDEYRKDFRDGNAPRVDASYRIAYTRDHLLVVRYRAEALGGGGPARYGVRHRVIDLRTGARVRAAQAFRPDALAGLVARVNQRLEEGRGTDAAPEVYTGPDDTPRFRVEDLDHFAIDDQGATFFLEFGFPHVFGEGPVDTSLTWDELRPYIRRDGPLEIFR